MDSLKNRPTHTNAERELKKNVRTSYCSQPATKQISFGHSSLWVFPLQASGYRSLWSYINAVSKFNPHCTPSHVCTFLQYLIVYTPSTHCLQTSNPFSSFSWPHRIIHVVFLVAAPIKPLQSPQSLRISSHRCVLRRCTLSPPHSKIERFPSLLHHHRPFPNIMTPSTSTSVLIGPSPFPLCHTVQSLVASSHHHWQKSSKPEWERLKVKYTFNAFVWTKMRCKSQSQGFPTFP